MIDAPDALDERDSPPPADVPLGPEPAPTPDPVDVPLGPAADGLTDTVRAMRDELAAHYKGANPPSIDLAIKAVQPGSAIPRSWDSRGMAGKAVKAYRDSIGGTPAKTEPARTAPTKPRRTTAVRTKPAPPVPVAVQPAVPPTPEPVVREPVPQPVEVVQPEPVPQAEPVVRTAPGRPVVWPVMLLAAPAFVAVWSGWVGLGKLTGFGKVNLLPGIGEGWVIDSAITLPVGVETYGAYALYIWLSGRVPARARTFAKWSAIASLVVGALGQVAYHLLVANGVTAAPWWITTLVACLPVAVLGMGAALAHLVREEA
ncbi:ABC transporter permease [Micromonospora taraxaci]|uniref:ABC transporter permease n=1 Tax=Micromonospora taraxaci TaxID=1316803 RepID=UPI0033E3F1C2